MQLLYNAVINSDLTYQQIASRSGVCENAMYQWFSQGRMSSVGSYQAVLEVVGYKLEIVKDD